MQKETIMHLVCYILVLLAILIVVLIWFTCIFVVTHRHIQVLIDFLKTDYILKWIDCTYKPPEITIEINTTSDNKADGWFSKSWKPSYSLPG